MSKQIEFTKAHQRCLGAAVFTDDDPGPVLGDFQVLLDFVRFQGGIEASGKFNLFPIKLIPEIDRFLSQPLHLDLKRPLLKSHPYLQGLHLLFRASGLGGVDGTGAKARLVVDPEMLIQWENLNPAERYFSLLEAWLRLGRPEMVGEESNHWAEMVLPCLLMWKSLPKEGKHIDIDRPTQAHFLGIDRHFYHLALLDLFGLVEVTPPPRPVAPWCPASVKPLPFGDAVCSLLHTQVVPSLLTPFVNGESEDANDEIGDEDSLEVPHFGVWQPLFQPYIPAWRENLRFPQRGLRQGTFVFRVSWAKVWRQIALPADATLEDLLDWVLRSFHFDSDHLHMFTYRDRLGTKVQVHYPQSDTGPWSDQVKIGALPLEPGQTMDLLYDFGDGWEFSILLDRIEPPGAKIKAPGIVARHGKAPTQYPSWDD